MAAPTTGALHLSEPAPRTAEPRGFAGNDGNGSPRFDGCSRDAAEVFVSIGVQAAGDLFTHHFGRIDPPKWATLYFCCVRRSNKGEGCPSLVLFERHQRLGTRAHTHVQGQINKEQPPVILWPRACSQCVKCQLAVTRKRGDYSPLASINVILSPHK